ncbi:agrin-like [Tetranychus urticae]|uniref:Kazal-like domain-containing protein n=1 Tax=Tetranychus urticae TaxID=32264 RepID=T1KCH0_TETUR|nr:agrin-like [Tetranychus urticae]
MFNFNKLTYQNCPSIIIFLVIWLTLSNFCLCYRLRFNNKLECRDKVPRKLTDLSNVVLTGFIEQTYPSLDNGEIYSGSVLVKRVFRGPSKFQGNRVTIDGLGDASYCQSKGQRGESWIFQLSQISDGYFRLNGTLLKLNLDNLDRINALVEDHIYRKRPDIVELPCEKKYCENNGVCIEESSGSVNRVRCVCLDSCPSTYEPVCGSNGETFVNECKLRMESCKRAINLFVRYPSACDSRRTVREAETIYKPLTNISTELVAIYREKNLF